jgi:hypothetical protein
MDRAMMQIEIEKAKLFLGDNMIVYITDPKNSTKKSLYLVKKHSAK